MDIPNIEQSPGYCRCVPHNSRCSMCLIKFPNKKNSPVISSATPRWPCQEPKLEVPTVYLRSM